MSNTDSPTKSWWSLSKASGNKEHQNYIDLKSATKRSSGLKSIATAIGLKSKKPSRESFSPVDYPLGSQVSHSTTSVKSRLSPVDSLAPHPFDTRLRRVRQSLLTLADDPFAGHPPVVSTRQSPVPSRSSVYSSPSVMDLISGKTDSPVYRSSYASSSTNSNSFGPDVNSTAMLNSHYPFPESKKLLLKRSIGSMQVKLPDGPSRQTSLMSSTGSSFSEGPQPVSDEASVRPRMRSRGMTVGGMQSQAPTTNTSVKAPEVSSQHVPRQTSSSYSRLSTPPTAPPTVSLPAPPQPTLKQLNFGRRKGPNSHPTSSSPSPSSLVNDHITSPHDESQISKQNLLVQDSSFRESVELSLKTAPSPRTLKKLPSQRSLRRAASPSSSISSKTTTTPDSSGKRKQRNSQSRLPMPTLPLSIRTSFVSQPHNRDPTSPHSINEQQRSRKRLFSSGSQRPSTATHVPTGPREDDTSSVSSLRSGHDTIHPRKPWAVTRNYPKPSSFWDESSDTTPSSPAVFNVDYQPQAIMSRDELAKLEASISNANPEPFGSTSSFPPSNAPEVFEQEPSRLPPFPPPSRRNEEISEWSTDASLASLTSQSGTACRPRTADPLVTDTSKGADVGGAGGPRCVTNTTAAHLDIITDSTSLPPPPRRRILSSNSVLSTSSTSTTSTLIQSPIERLNYSKIKLLDPTASSLQPSALGTRSLPAPRSVAASRGKARTSGVLEKAIQRRSIMRKPSFLEIDGETDPESELDVAEKRDSLFLNMKPPSATTVTNGSSKTGESFLDLARESFDTMRS